MAAFHPLLTQHGAVNFGREGGNVPKRLGMAAAAMVVAAFAQFLTLLMAGAGHGWVEPVWFSAAMWITLPLMASRVVQYEDGVRMTVSVDASVLVAALILDGLLVVATLKTDNPLFHLGSGGRVVLKEASGGTGHSRPLDPNMAVVAVRCRLASVFSTAPISRDELEKCQPMAAFHPNLPLA